MSEALVVLPLSPEHDEGFRALFDASSSSCFCRYWLFGGTKNEWLDRCAHRAEENLADQVHAVAEGDVAARGLVALAAGEVVGWMKLAPRESLPKLRRLPVYRSLALGDDATTYSVGCFLVRPDARHRGVARALLAAADEAARRWGATAIEGYPRRSTDPLYDEEVWQGPERLFTDAGFVAVHDEGPYPVYRKMLVSGA